MTAYVIDASVASRFLLVEDLSDEAGSLLEGFLNGSLDLEAPELVVYEVGNTLWKSAKQGLITANEATQKFSYFLKLRIDSIKLNEEDHREVLQWSLEDKATYYDSAYVKASEKAKATLLTADDVLYSKGCRKTPTLHLKDFQK